MLTWLLPIIALITALGVWFGPQLAERRRRRKEIEGKIKRQVLELESPFAELDEEEIERDWLAIGKGAIKPLKRELEATEDVRARRTILMALYKLGDKEVRKAILARFEGILRTGELDEVQETLEDIEKLKIGELAPLLFEKLQEKDDDLAYGMIRTLGRLRYGPALSYLVQLATERLKETGESDDHIFHACITAIGDITPKGLNMLTNEELHRIANVFTTALKGKDRHLIDGVVRCELPWLLKRRDELRDPLKKELVEALVQLLDHKDGDIRKEAVRRLMQLGDKRAVPYLRELQKREMDATVKPYLERALRVLER